VQHYLWRAVDQQGAVIDILVQPKRDRFAKLSKLCDFPFRDPSIDYLTSLL
jgi:DDE domain